MKHPLVTSSDVLLSAQPDDEILIIRSNSAGDTTQSVALAGNVSSAPDSESIAFAGQKEVEGTLSFESLISAILDASLAGTGTVLGQGTAGTGDIRVDAVPAGGDVLVLGLTGHLRTYTYRSPCRATILCPAGSALVTGASPASYVSVALNGSTRYFWFSNGTSIDPAPGGTGYAVAFTGGDADTVVAAALRASMVTNLTNFSTSVDSATVTITGIALGAITLTQDAGADFGLTTVQAGTADAANQIRTGYTIAGAAVTTADIAGYIDAVLNVDGTSGQQYGTGTAIHADIEGTGATGSLADISDRLACNRLLTWATTGTTADLFTIRMPSEGVDGATIAEFNGTTQLLASQLTFDNEDLSSDNLPPGVVVTGNAIYLGGRPFGIYAKSEQTTNDISVDYQVSNDGTNWRAGETAIPINSNSATAGDRDKYIAPTEMAEYARLRITDNTETVARALNFCAVSG